MIFVLFYLRLYFGILSAVRRNNIPIVFKIWVLIEERKKYKFFNTEESEGYK